MRWNITENYRFGYQGQFAEEDDETEYNQFEARLYDGRIGRWMVPDPAGQYWSPYLGMGNSPVIGVDPDGSEYYTNWFGTQKWFETPPTGFRSAFWNINENNGFQYNFKDGSFINIDIGEVEIIQQTNNYKPRALVISLEVYYAIPECFMVSDYSIYKEGFGIQINSVITLKEKPYNTYTIMRLDDDTKSMTTDIPAFGLLNGEVGFITSRQDDFVPNFTRGESNGSTTGLGLYGLNKTVPLDPRSQYIYRGLNGGLGFDATTLKWKMTTKPIQIK